MKKHTLIGLAQVQRVTHFFRGPPLDLAQENDEALAIRQVLDNALDLRQELGTTDERLRPLVRPRRRRHRPAAAIVEADGQAPRFELVLERKRREWDGTTSASRGGARPIEQNPADPGAQRGTALEARQAAHDPHPCLLDDLVDEVAGPDHTAREPAQHPIHGAHQLDERSLVARTQS